MSRPPRPLTAFGDELLTKRLVANVAGKGDRFASFRSDQLDDLFGVRLLDGQISEGHIGAFARTRWPPPARSPSPRR